MKTMTTDEMVLQLRTMAAQILTAKSKGKTFFNAVADELEHRVIRGEDNKGGDYITIVAIPNCQNDLLIEVGHQCVVFVRHRVPVAMLTAILAEHLKSDADLPWSNDFNAVLRSRFQPEVSVI
jgi:hypothetical protein